MSCSKVVLLSVLYSFASPSNLLKYLKLRYSRNVVQDLNHVIRLKGKCAHSKEGIQFLLNCLDYYVTTTDIKECVRKCKPKHAAGLERAFLRDELEKRRDFFESVKKEFSLKVWRVCCELSFFDQLRFCKLVNRTAERLQNQAMAKKKQQDSAVVD